MTTGPQSPSAPSEEPRDLTTRTDATPSDPTDPAAQTSGTAPGGAQGDASGDDSPAGPGPRSLRSSSMIMAAGTAVSRVLGLVRNMLLVAAVGVTGLAADTFDVANKIPNFLFAIIAGGVLNAVIVPQIVRIYRGRNPEENVSKLLTLATLVMLVVTLIMTAGASVIVGIYASSSWSDAQVALGVSFAVWCIPQLFFYGLYALLGQVLNARQQFGPYMWSPAVNNVISIAGFAAFIAIYGLRRPGTSTTSPRGTGRRSRCSPAPPPRGSWVRR
ncbi:hypothetical protein GCM10025865_13500 [Paraoerskovia sediminicola]|uniref:Integral membrane protein MviN n=1 Tax=Paraoerskovia sediminicola TaxID=1138587 RepID=A0ABM8G1R4_9CELL|nr:lipid II flippase MurJ [Paraoerskovia sediminicola]BDZ42051.1 hypothetical protein GCM10025865_13500 [Paraoerskovia sediminicola]